MQRLEEEEGKSFEFSFETTVVLLEDNAVCVTIGVESEFVDEAAATANGHETIFPIRLPTYRITFGCGGISEQISISRRIFRSAL